MLLVPMNPKGSVGRVFAGNPNGKGSHALQRGKSQSWGMEYFTHSTVESLLAGRRRNNLPLDKNAIEVNYS